MLGNYKIRVNNEAESKEAQELFFEIGGSTGSCDRFGMVCLSDGRVYTDRVGFFEDYDDCEEITLSQLRDLVVLHRNDVNDATHVGNYCGHFYVTCDGDIYSWEKPDVWEKNNYNTIDDIKPIQAQTAKQGLISGADTLRALEDGKEVEFKCGGSYWRLLDAKQQPLEILIDQKVQFRLKPTTITLNVEIPTPFEPKDGEIFWFVSPYTYKGYDSKYFVDDCTGFLLNGVWRTEEQIKKVVTALRNSIKGVDNV